MPRQSCLNARGITSRFVAILLMAAMVVPGFLNGRPAAAAADFDIGDIAVVADGPLNVRNGAGTGNGIMLVLADGERVRINNSPTVKNGYSWYYFTLIDRYPDSIGSVEGWVAGEFLADADDGIQEGDGLRVVDGPVNLRETPGLDGEILRQIPEGGIVATNGITEEADGYTWVNVWSNGYGEGWIATDFVEVDPDGYPGEDGGDGIEAGDGLRVVDGPINLREEPGLDGDIIRTIPQGAIVATNGIIEVADGYSWVNVWSNGYGEGWIATAFIEVDPNGYPGEEGSL